jgi:NAD-dependent SIR2 family protein deacetylase
MPNSKQIVFLGAGASASDGAPIQNSLFQTYFSSNPDPVSASLRKFFIDFYGIDPLENQVDVKYPSFEELLGILEISLSRAESFKGYPITPANPDIQRLREELIFLIAKILKENLRDRPRTNHDHLVSRLIRDDTLKNTVFISLNYDILIDNSLTDIHDEYDLDYGIEFANFGERNGWHAPRKTKAIKLLKLHGSLNWLYCPTCTSVRITPKVKSVSTIAHIPVNCTACNTYMTPIIIPPTFFKVMSNFHLQKIWKIAETHLSQCDNLIFCGHSLPDADVHIKYLIKRMEVNSNKSPSVFIFNNHEGKNPQIFQEEKSRFETFFRNKERVSYLESSFEDFCNHGTPKNSR